jgi:[protein-PII] uridylyltransferase
VGLAAVGSYGRGALAFFSDLDVRLISSTRAEKVRPVAEALLYPLWDAGLSIGHQVVTGNDMLDLAKNDLPTATSLLDWRVLVGDRSASDKMLTRAFDGIFGAGNIKKFLDRLEAKAEERSERFGGSVYLLEPDVKNGIGGLRDIDLAHWAARARWRVSSLAELVRHGVLLPREWQQIEEAHALLWRVRNLLHVQAGRRSDRLSFDRQESLALDLGYGTGGAGVEAFMSDYYQKARVISRLRELVLARAAPPPKRRPRETSIGRGLKLTNDQLSFEDPAQVEQEPALALRLYDEAVRRDLAVYPFARDLVARAITSPSFCERLRASEAGHGRAAHQAARRLGAQGSARHRPARGDDSGVCARGRPRASRRVSRVHGRRALSGRGGSLACAVPRRAGRRAPARFSLGGRDFAPQRAVFRRALARHR